MLDPVNPDSNEDAMTDEQTLEETLRAERDFHRRHALFEAWESDQRAPMALEEAVAEARDRADGVVNHQFAVLRDLDGGHWVAPIVGSWGVPPKAYAGRVVVYQVNSHGGGYPNSVIGQEWRRAREIGFDIPKGYQCEPLPKIVWVAGPPEAAAEDVWTVRHHTSRRRVVREMRDGDVLAARRIDGGQISDKPAEASDGTRGFRVRGEVVSVELFGDGTFAPVPEGEWPRPGTERAVRLGV